MQWSVYISHTRMHLVFVNQTRNNLHASFPSTICFKINTHGWEYNTVDDSLEWDESNIYVKSIALSKLKLAANKSRSRVQNKTL